MANSGPGLLSLQGFAYTTGLGNSNIGTQQLFATTTYHYADNVTVTRGRHMMKMGANVLREEMNFFYAGNNGRSGFMNFGFGMAGIISPVVFGWAIDATGRWDVPFIGSLAMLLIGAVLAMTIHPQNRFVDLRQSPVPA